MRRSVIATALLLVSAASTPAFAAAIQNSTSQAEQLPNTVDVQELGIAQTLLSKSSAVLAQFNSDTKMLALMRQAKAVLIIPDFGHGSSAPAGPWGSGVLLAQSNGRWSDPVFYTFGGGSLGQTIANGGALVLFVMKDGALAKFQRGSDWSLDSTQGTSIVNYSAAMPQDLSGQGADFIAWSASGGPHADTQVSITGISFDTAANTAVYGTTDLRNILASRTPYLNPDVISLVRHMPAAESAANNQKRIPAHVDYRRAQSSSGADPAGG